MRKTLKNRKKGGRFLSYGSYGCTYIDPPLKCKGENTRRVGKLSKLMRPEEAEKEIIKNTILKNIDPEKKYTLWTDELCNFDSFEETNKYSKNKKEECDYPKIIGDVKLAKLLMLDKADVDLDKIILSPSEYANFFAGFKNLIEGVLLFKNNNISHMDIKPPNMVSTKNKDGTFKLQFIDFGLTNHVENINMNDEYNKFLQGKDSIYVYTSYNYIYYPFEFRFVYRPSVPDPKVNYDYNRWIETTLKSVYIPENTYKSLTEQKMTSILSKVDLFDTAAVFKRVDIYSLGISFCEIYNRLTGHYSGGSDSEENKQIMMYSNRFVPLYYYNGHEVKSYNIPKDIFDWHKNLAEKVSAPMYELIEGMVNFDPNVRYTPEEVLLLFDEYILPNLSDAFNSPGAEKALKYINIDLKAEEKVNWVNNKKHLRKKDVRSVLNKSGKVLPYGWTRVTNSVNTWYEDELSNKPSQWNPPEPAKQIMSTKNNTGKILPYGWFKVDNGQRTWYYNEETKQIQFERPS